MTKKKVNVDTVDQNINDWNSWSGELTDRIDELDPGVRFDHRSVYVPPEFMREEDSVFRHVATGELRGLLTITHRGCDPDAAVPVLLQRLRDQHRYRSYCAAKQIGNFGVLASDAAPRIIELLNTEGTSDLRETLSTSLRSVVGKSGDDDLDDFSHVFLTSVFHPEPKRNIARVMDHRWLLKLIQSQLRKLTDGSPEATSNFIEDVRQEFALRLVSDPRLGLSPARFKELPGYMKNHARQVARNVCRRYVGRCSLRDASGDQPICTDQLVNAIPAKERPVLEQVILTDYREDYQRFVRRRLAPLQRNAIECKVVQGMTYAETAAALGTRVPRVRYALDSALALLRRRYQLPRDRKVVILFIEAIGFDF